MQAHQDFCWDQKKNALNIQKHDVSFDVAQQAFKDTRRVLAVDIKHSTRQEQRFFCYGMVEGKVLTVRFIYRNSQIRIFGAGFWREGRKFYYEKNELH